MHRTHAHHAQPLDLAANHPGTYRQAPNVCLNRAPIPSSAPELVAALLCTRAAGHDGPHMLAGVRHSWPITEGDVPIVLEWDDDRTTDGRV